MARLREQIPTLRAGVVASIVAAVLGSAVNDSGAIVGGVTLFVLVASLAWLALDATALAATEQAGRAGDDAEKGSEPGASAATGRTRRPTAGAVETQAIASARGASAGSEPS